MTKCRLNFSFDKKENDQKPIFVKNDQESFLARIIKIQFGEKMFQQ